MVAHSTRVKAKISSMVDESLQGVQSVVDCPRGYGFQTSLLEPFYLCLGDIRQVANACLFDKLLPVGTLHGNRRRSLVSLRPLKVSFPEGVYIGVARLFGNGKDTRASSLRSISLRSISRCIARARFLLAVLRLRYFGQPSS